MKYMELLREYITKSGLSLSQIEEKMKEKGFSTNKAYISKLQNGKIPPASEDITRALAEITGGDPDKLVWYGYIEKAPDGMRDILYAVGDEVFQAAKKVNDKYPGFLSGKHSIEDIKNTPEYQEFNKVLTEAFKQVLSNAQQSEPVIISPNSPSVIKLKEKLKRKAEGNLTFEDQLEEALLYYFRIIYSNLKANEELNTVFIEEIEKEQFEFIKTYTYRTIDEIMDKMLHLSLVEKLSLLKFAEKFIKKHGLMPKLNYLNEATYQKEDFEIITNTLTVPVLGYIAAGAPILAQEHIVEYMEIPNPGKYQQGELFVLIVKGDSMIGSRIYPGDKVVVKIQPDVESGEIAVVNVNGDEATLKKVKKYEDGSVWLISTNEKYAPIPLKDGNARIIGKVIQVIFEPK